MNKTRDIVAAVRQTIGKFSMISPQDHVLAALSGGPDSVCLVTILNGLMPEFEGRLSAVYIDHGLRPDEAAEEREFCKDLCGALGIPFYVKSIHVRAFAGRERLSMQEAARELRLAALHELASEVGARRIALGHTADDQAETMLLRLFRGTGPAGLTGMRPVRDRIIRPLIETPRTEIEGYLDREGLAFMVDSSNLKDKYLRNRIRHHIMPVLQGINRDVVSTLLHTTEILRDEERYFSLLVTKSLMKLISRKSDTSIELFLVPLYSMDTVLLRRVLRRAIEATKGLRGITFMHIEEIIGLIKTGRSGARIYLPRDIRVIKGYSTLVITSDRPVRLSPSVIEGPGQTVIREASLILRISVHRRDSGEEPAPHKTVALADAAKVRFPLLMRGRATGDFFLPLGFGKKKKLQDFFVDEKIPRDERDAIPLIVQSGDIVWIAGHRLDERFRVDESTTEIIKFEIGPSK